MKGKFTFKLTAVTFNRCLIWQHCGICYWLDDIETKLCNRKEIAKDTFSNNSCLSSS